MKKIIIIKNFLLFYLCGFNCISKKIIEIKNLTEIEDLLIKELKINKDDKNTIILLDGKVIFNFKKLDGKKNYKKFNNKNEDKEISKSEKKHQLTLKKDEYKLIVEKILEKFNNLYIVKTGFQEEIKLINNSYEIFYLPVRQKYQDKDPVIIGKIIFDSFLRHEIIIYLINLYKKLQIKKIIYITNNKNINFQPLNKEEFIIIYLPKQL